MYLIHAFWFVAVYAADSSANWPVYCSSFANSWIWLRPILLVAAWVVNSSRLVTSESEAPYLATSAHVCLCMDGAFRVRFGLTSRWMVRLLRTTGGTRR